MALCMEQLSSDLMAEGFLKLCGRPSLLEHYRERLTVSSSKYSLHIPCPIGFRRKYSRVVRLTRFSRYSVVFQVRHQRVDHQLNLY
jgi:hypothetical protein